MKAPAGTRDGEQSGRGAAIICVVYGPSDRSDLARELAGAFLDGTWKAPEVAERGAGCLDRWPAWMGALEMHVVSVHRAPPTDRPEELVGLIATFLAERPAPSGESEPPLILRRLVGRRRPLDHGWPIAAIESVDALAERLELSDGQLAWLADVRGLERTVTVEKLRNYRYRTVHRRDGLPRVIEAPKARIKEVQRWVLRDILDQVPAHDSAHGFVRGRSVVTHAALHTGQAAVLRLDLKDFFASIAAGRVYGMFRTAGYGRAVAHVLTGLCTNTVPLAVWNRIPRPTQPELVPAQFWLGRQLATPHLPQGAPSSPALANLVAFGLDRRLTALAASLGLRYSRYADDLTFSGPRYLLARRAQVEDLVATITREEGFAVNAGKTSLSSTARRQSVCGVVVNAHPNVTRGEYDRLKAILHNVARYGAASQNRAGVSDLEAHLRGRIAWVASVNPDRGAKLRRRFADISWDQ